MPKKKNVLNFQPKKKIPKQSKEKGIIDEGSLGDLHYKIYSRGVIHIYDDKNRLFKKDCTLFEETVDELDINSLKDGEQKKIPGSGDNDTLVFTCKDSDVIISLEKPEYNMITKLKNLLKKGQKKE